MSFSHITFSQQVVFILRLTAGSISLKEWIKFPWLQSLLQLLLRFDFFSSLCNHQVDILQSSPKQMPYVHEHVKDVNKT